MLFTFRLKQNYFFILLAFLPDFNNFRLNFADRHLLKDFLIGDFASGFRSLISVRHPCISVGYPRILLGHPSVFGRTPQYMGRTPKCLGRTP